VSGWNACLGRSGSSEMIVVGAPGGAGGAGGVLVVMSMSLLDLSMCWSFGAVMFGGLSAGGRCWLLCVGRLGGEGGPGGSVGGAGGVRKGSCGGENGGGAVS
jgi:hypothetical protein